MSESQPSESLQCPECGAAAAPDARFCSSCGTTLLRDCPACGAPNKLGARECTSCGQRLEILDTLFDRLTTDRAKWLNQLQQEAPAVKVQAEEASQARLQEMWALEAQRREELQQALIAREHQQRILVIAIVIAVAAVLVAVLVTLALALR